MEPLRRKWPPMYGPEAALWPRFLSSLTRAGNRVPSRKARSEEVSQACGRQRTRCLMLALFAGALVIMSLACTEVRAGSDRSSNPGAALLSYVVREKPGSATRYRWILRSPDSNQEQVFVEVPEPPKLVFWDTKESKVYYVRGSRIFAAAYPQAHAVPSYVTKLPSPDAAAMWIERTTGRLRVIVLEEIPESSISRKTDGTLIYRLDDGSSVPAPGLPDWGDSGVCTVLELGSGGKWTLMARRATKYGAGETPGLDVVNGFRHESGVSQDRLLMSYTCAYGKILRKDLPTPMASSLREVVNFPATDFRYLPPADNLDGIVFRTVMGDTLHAAAPVFLVSQRDQTLRQIKLDREDQIGFARNSRYLLLANEYSGDNPILLDLETGNTVFSIRAHAAVWVP